jgi:adenine C2-methylase RlmN of 23S rRNA A2503 and tRNA A37
MFNQAKTLISKIDKSVNWLLPVKNKGLLETRYVRKKSEYIISYVSSSTGCNQGCKFCYLTQQKQTSSYHVNNVEYMTQVNKSLNHYKIKDFDGLAKRININFMARGEPLANKNIVTNFPELYEDLYVICDNNGLEPKINISTIMPNTIKYYPLQNIFQGYPVYLYYSLYSVNDSFRNVWLPNAMDYFLALGKLKEYQESGGNIITFHWALIKGQNDGNYDINELAKLLRYYKFNAKFNIVRYNNHPNLNHQESDPRRIQEIFDIINDALGNNSKSYIVPRVGPDVFASCGMFVEDTDL